MDSKFTGGVFAHFFYSLAVDLVSILTLGFCYPFIVCGYWRWKADHTYINGLKLKFSGKTSALFKKYILWWVLSFITLGVYAVLKLNYDITKWKTENTHIEGREEQKSYLYVSWLKFFGAQILSGMAISLTLGIGYSWVHCAFQEWLCRYTYISGNGLDFNGKGWKYLKKLMVWLLLTVITLGIYGFWTYTNNAKWNTAHTYFKFKERVIAGKPVLQMFVKAVSKPVKLANKVENELDSKFTGGVFAHFFYSLAVDLVSILTLGFCYPFIVCGYWRWKADHTYINGLKLKFSGKTSALFKKYILWWVLSFITLGVYAVLKLNYDITKWKTENTHIEGREEQASYLDVSWYRYFGANVLSGLMTALTLGIGYSWVHCAYQEWLCRYTYISGNSFDFEGEGKEYLKKLVLWSLLTVITLGIYGVWTYTNNVKWNTAQTSFKFKEKVAAGETVLITRPLPVLPKAVEAVSKPVPGEHFKKVYDYMKVRRAMMCFTCEIPFLVCVTILMAYTVGYLTFIIAPLLLWFVVLLSLPAIFIVEERFKDTAEMKLKSAKAWSVTGLIFSLAIPVFLPVFIYGLIETVRLKEWICANEETGAAIIAEQEAYFDMSKKYQNYIWDCSNYKKAVKNYAKSMIEYNEKLKAYNNATAVK